MSIAALVGVVAAVTVGSRLVAIAVVPPPRGRVATVVDRLPAPLFAVLAAVTCSAIAALTPRCWAVPSPRW